MLRISEIASLTLVALNLGAATWIIIGERESDLLKVPLLAGFTIVLLLYLVVAAQVTQLARARSPELSHQDDLEGLSSKELGRVLRWSPVAHKVVGCLGLVLFVFTFVAVGAVSWSTGTPFEHHHAVGVALYGAALSAIAAPVLAAFSRMPRSVAERVALLRSSDT
jgi:hypothetical protein